jgi:hypothetical protein
MRAPMSSRTPEHFVEVARLISGDTFPEWLPWLLHCWVTDLFRELWVEQHRRPTRAQIRRRLGRLVKATLLVSEELEPGSLREYLETELNSPLCEPERIISELEDLAVRADRAMASSRLAGESGVTRPGSGKARPAASVPPKTYCALLILETWKFFHGTEPLPKSRKAAEAAELYWRAAGGDTHSSDDEPLARWRYHFKLARPHGVKSLTAEYRRHLVENDRSWKLLYG